MSTSNTLIEEARTAYSAKKFLPAAELYAQACAAHAEETGDDSPDLLFEYGRALYHVAVSTSDLLYDGSAEKKANSEVETAEVEAEVEAENEAENEGSEDENAGDEDGNEDGNEDNEGEGEENDGEDNDEDEDDDDFVAAWKVLDVVRVMLEKQLVEQADDKTAAKETEKKLADTYALLGEISLEDDNYPQAVEDFRNALERKAKIYDADSKLLSEANYMLSLAYEFRAEGPEDSKSALKHMKAAVSVAKAAKCDADVLKDLEARAKELEQDINDGKDKGALADATADIAGREAIAGALSQMMSGATDISTMVRKKKTSKRKAPADEEKEVSSKQRKL